MQESVRGGGRLNFESILRTRAHDDEALASGEKVHTRIGRGGESKQTKYTKGFILFLLLLGMAHTTDVTAATAPYVT